MSNLQLLALQQLRELGLCLVETHGVRGVNNVYNAVSGSEVFGPEPAGGHVAPKIVGGDDEAPNLQHLRVRVQGGLVERDAVVFELGQQRRLAGVVEAEEKHSALLVRQAEVAKHALEPVYEKHCVAKKRIGERLGDGTRTFKKMKEKTQKRTELS